jgi:hypothetical protein
MRKSGVYDKVGSGVREEEEVATRSSLRLPNPLSTAAAAA